MFPNIFQHLQKMWLFKLTWFFVHKRSSNTNIKLISYLVNGDSWWLLESWRLLDQMNVLHTKKKAIIRIQQYQILESKILQHQKQVISFYWLTQFNQIQDWILNMLIAGWCYNIASQILKLAIKTPILRHTSIVPLP